MWSTHRKHGDRQWLPECNFRPGLSPIFSDLRFSVRSFTRAPGPALALVFTIALGTGGNATISAVVAGFDTPAIRALLRFSANAVLFVACVNVAAFLLSRAAVRAQETSVRVALGAGFGDLARELAADSVVISTAGGACGVVASLWISRLLPAMLYEGDASKMTQASPDLLAVAARVAACVGVTIVCGLVPLFFTSHDRPVLALRNASAGPSPTSRRLRAVLMAAQMAGCCVPVVGTAYLFDNFHAAVQTNAGRRSGVAIVATVRAESTAGFAYYRAVDRAARSLPSVRETAWTGRLPGALPALRSYRLEPPQLPMREFAADIAWLSARTIEQLDVEPSAGRFFGRSDQSCRTAVVNEAAARELFGPMTPGRTLRDGGGPPIEIIGVVKTTPAQKRAVMYYNYTAQRGAPPTATPSARFRRTVDSKLAEAELDTNVVSENYFEAMGVTMPARGWSGDGACRVGLVNREASERYFGGNPTGAAVIDGRGERTAIVGVVDPPALGVFQRRPEPAMYLPLTQDALPTMTLIAWGDGGTERRAAILRGAIAAVPGGALTPGSVETLERYLEQTALAPIRIATLLVGASAALGLLLSGIGVFGALSDAGRRRRRELALRIALGAPRWRVMAQVLREGGRLAVAGSTAGTAGAALLFRAVAGALPATGAPRWWVWLAAPAALFAATALASVLPARRASIVNPVSALRDEN